MKKLLLPALLCLTTAAHSQTVSGTLNPNQYQGNNLVLGVYSATVTSAGGAASHSYVPADTVTLTGGTETTNAVLTVTDTQLSSVNSVAAGGTGCTNGSGKILTGTTGTGTKFQVSATVSGNAVTSVDSITVAGDYTANPSSLTAEPVTGDSCTGAQLSINMGAKTVSIKTPGAYTVVPANPVAQGSSSGSGTGATFTLAFNVASQLNVGGTTIASGTNGDVEYNNSGVLGEFALGTGVKTALGNATNTSGGAIVPVTSSWAPVVSFIGGNTGMSATCNGSYTQYGSFVGAYVIATFACALTAIGSASGNATITGLPFTSNSNNFWSSGSIWEALNMQSLTGGLYFQVGRNGTTINILQAAATGDTAVTAANFTATTSIAGTVYYAQ